MKWLFTFTSWLRIALFSVLSILSYQSFATTFTVTTLADSGAGSLRQAILDANADAGAPHTINFSISGTINLASPLPAFTRDIDVIGGGVITINAQGGDINRDIFTLNAGASGSTIKGLTLDGTGTEAIQINAALSNVTIEDVTIQSKLGGECNCINHGIYVAGAATNMMIKNVSIKDIQYGAYWAIRFVSTATNVTIDGLTTGGVSDIGGGDSRGIQFQGVANGVTIQNTVIDLNDKNSGNDGNYGIYFNTNVSNLTINNLTMDDAEVYSLYIGGTASTVNISNSTFENFNGYGGYPMIRFNNTASGVTINNIMVNADQTNTTNDADYGLYFNASVQNTTISNSTFKNADIAGIWFTGSNLDNLTISGNTISSNGNGADAQGGIIFRNVRNTSSDGGAILVTNNTINYSNGEAVGVYPGNSTSYVLPNFTISNNTIFNTKSNYGGINVQYVDKVVITQNSIYNNKGRGIELTYAGNGGYEGTKTPVLMTSTPNGVNTYDLKLNLPSICATGLCNVEIYVSEPQHYGTGGQTYVTTLTGLSSGMSTHTINCGLAPCGDGMNSPYGVWTATLRIPTNNFGTSEFSNKLPVQPNGPACVNSGVKLWLRADLGLYDQNLDVPYADGIKLGFWEDFSGGGAPSSTTIVNDPKTKLVGMNYNPVADMDGDVIRGHFTGTPSWISGTAAITTVAAFKPLSISANGDRMFVLYNTGYDYNNNKSTIPFYKTGTNIQTDRGNTPTGGAETPPITGAFDKAGVFSSVTNATTHTMHYNGTSLGSGAYNKGNFDIKQWFVGGGYYAGWKAGAEVDFGEVITYNRELNATELQKVHTYLAIKYGITLSQDYIASNGTTFWSISTNSGYNSAIAGMAKDACSVLEQKQSRAEGAVLDVLTVALGDSVASSNVENEKTVTNNISALIWGHNGLTTLYDQSISNPYSDTRMKRIWRVQKTNWADQNVTVCVQGGNANKTMLISNADPTFTTINHYKTLNSKGCVTFSSADLANGAYFTFGNRIVGPACVTSGIQGWYRADDGSATGSSWLDFSGQDHHATQATAASQPLVIANGINFNAALDFDGSNDYMDIAHGLGISGTNNFTVIGMGMRQAVSTWDVYVAQPGINTGDFIFGPASTNKTGVGRTNQGSVFGTGTYATANIPQFVSATRSGNTFTFYSNGANDGAASATYSFNTDNMRIGNRGASGDVAYNGYISEVIVYNRVLSALELQKVHSYLALKYGVTLGTGTTDYVASTWNGSSGTKMWTAADNAGYGNDIAGIGKDTCANFHQRQSKSINSDNLFTIAMGDETATSNATNIYDVKNDLSFLTWGNNNLATTFTSNVTSDNATLRMPRVWKVDKTNWADTLITLCYTGTDATNLYLLISADPAFASITDELPIDKDTKCVGLNTALLGDASHFTFAKAINGPACVNSNIVAWLRADANTSGFNWNDYSGKNNNPTFTNDPEVSTTRYLNFNQVVYYDGNDSHTFPTTAQVSGQFSMFGVTQMEGTQNGRVFESTVGNNLFGYHGNTENDLHIAGWLNNSGTVATTNPHIYSLQRASSGAYEFRNKGKIIKSGATSSNQTWRLNVGGTSAYNEPSKVFVGEVAIYNSDLSPTDVNRIESYFGLKYGITLDQTTPMDYIASDGVTRMWTAADNTGYGNDIAGIGKDECTGLHQKQSKSVNTDDLITMAVGSSVAVSNVENLNEVLTDNTYLVWSNNNGATSAFSTMVPKTGINATDRMARIWKVDKSTDWTDTDITICVSQNGGRYLLVDSNGATFDDDGNTVEYKLSPTTGCITLNSSALPDGAYFTVATKKAGPACVNTGIQAWFRGDYGYTESVGPWVDFSGNNKTATKIAGTPGTGAINFNTAVDFGGSANFQIPLNTRPDGMSTLSTFIVYKADVASRTIFGNDNGAADDRTLYMHTICPGCTGITGINVTTQSKLVTTVWQQGVTNGTSVRSDGLNVYTGTKTSSNNGATVTWLGRGYSAIASGSYFDGRIAEFVIYNTNLSISERQRIESYLALKYGITLDQTTPTDYLASDGTTKMWDATINASYKYEIAGIGRDDCTELHQKQSKSVNAASNLTVALGDAVQTSNLLNTNEVLTDNTYLVWGHNNGSTNFEVTLTGTTDATARMGRIWRVDKSAAWSDTEITLCFDGQDDQSYLVIDDTDAAFGSVNYEYQLDANGCVTILSSDLMDGAYFTVGRSVKGPGCVNGGIMVWLKADYGASVAEWTDFSGNSNNATQATVANQPTITTSGINYNPAFNFDGTNDHLTIPYKAGFNQNITVFTVLQQNVASGYRAPIGSRTTSFRGWNYYHDVSNREFWTGGGAAWSVLNDGAYTLSTPEIVGLSATLGTGNSNKNIYINGQNVASITNGSYLERTSGALHIGSNSDPATYWNGSIAEAVVYNGVLNATDRQKVQSYLALKYGITINQTSPTDYIASDGTTTMWDASDNTGYDNDIAGIGRDDCTALNQKQSKSVNSDAIFTMGIGTVLAANNASNTEDINTDKSFLVWGNNNLATTFTTDITSFAFPGGPNLRTPRIWKVDKTNWSDEEITICVNQTGERWLIVDTDAADAPMNEVADLVTYKFDLATGCVVINSSELADGTYFSLGTNISGPACVDSGIKLWLRADYGASVAGTWSDFSGNLNTASQATVANQPAKVDAAINYNPALDFDGTNDKFAFATGLSATDPSTFFFVSRTDVINTSYQTLAEFGNDRPGLYWRSGRANNYTYDVTTPDMLHPTIYTVNDPTIFAFASNNANTKNFLIGANGLESSFTGADGTYSLGTGATGASLGGVNSGSGISFNGHMSEVVVYNRVLTAIERQLVSSYLALKYGITLSTNNDGDGTSFEVLSGSITEGDYVASNSTIYWDASANSTYHNDVAGVGKDECTELDQKQSKSSNTDDFVKIGVGSIETTNALNTSVITNDLSFLMWGNNNGTTAYDNAVTSTTATVRMNRVWKVDKTNWEETGITVCFTGYGTQGNEYLLTSTSATFASVTAEHQLDANGCVIIQTDDLPDGGYFTIGKALAGPACVNFGIRTWQRADDGVSTITDWFDASGNFNTATQAVATDQATALAGSESTAINFNPGFLFETSVDFFDYNNNLGLAGTANNTVIWVANSLANTATTQAVLSHSGTGTNLFLAYHVTATNNPAVGVGGGGSTCAPTSLGGVPYNSALIGTYNRTSAASATMYTNGGFPNTGTCNSNFVGQNMRIGARHSSAYQPFNGNISEVIVYNRSLSTLELNKVHSYLALKYGITLNNGATDYVASNWDGTTGTKMWTAADNTGYGKDLAGIGRDTCTDLYQKQSKSVNSGALITMAIGSAVESSNTNNGGTIPNDRSFLVWSDNGGTTTFGTTVTGLTNATTRMQRIWKVDKTNWSDQNITVCAAQGGERYLLISSDATFGAGDTELAFNTTTGCVTFNSSLLGDGAHFTLGNKIVGPACVNAGIAAWYRADYGASGANWTDFSGNNKNATQATVANQPVVTTNGINFNAGLTFDGSNDFFTYSSDLLGTGNTPYTIVGIGSGTGGALYSEGSTATNQGMMVRNTSPTASHDFSSSGFTTGSIPNTPRLMAFQYNNSTNIRSIALNGAAATNSGAIALNKVSSIRNIGRDIVSATYYNGTFSELVVYNRVLTAVEQQQVNSYLALKYGITLNNGATDYVASDWNGTTGTKMWTAADNTGFANDIAGIGKDDCTDLYQKQSKSVNTDDIVTISVGGAVEASNALNTNEILNDKSFLVWANNDGNTDFDATVAGTNVTARLARVWKVDKTNWSDGDITLCFTGYDDQNYLLISNSSATFATIDKETQLDGVGCITINSADLPDGAYFTLGKNIIGPACVNGGVKGWYRADDGTVAGSLWTDFSNNGNAATQATVANQPIVVASGVNFNPYVDFDGTNDRLDINNNLDLIGTNPFTTIAVYQADVTGVRHTFWGGDGSVTASPFQFIETTNLYTMGASGTGNKSGVATMSANVPGISAFVRSASTTFQHYLNGATDGTAGNIAAFGGSFPTSNISLGARGISGLNPLNGKLSEVIFYNRTLSALELQKVNSYLALKYGITLNNGATDYVASNWDGSTGTKMWDATVNTGYNQNIAGIGRDSCTGLLQKQSKSVNSGSLVTVALGTSVAATNAANTSIIAADRTFFVWGSNGGTTTFNQSVPVLTGVTANTRMARIWKVDKTNWTDQDITICVTQSGERALLVDKGNGLFNTDGDVSQYNFNFTTGCVTIGSDQIPDGAYFTIATSITGPGCVDTGIKLWLRSDYGITTSSSTVAQWNDFSGNGHSFVQNGANPLPLFENSTNANFNFNPSLDFVATGSEQLRDAAVGDLVDPATSDLYSMFMVIVKEADNQRPLTFANSGSNLYAMDVNVGGRGSAPFDYENALTIPNNQTKILGLTYDGTAPNRRGYHNGKLTVDPALTTALTINDISNGQAELGAANGNGNFGGHMAEVVVYNRQITLAEAQRVNSYLALKYGITMDQTTAQDYIASDGTTLMWDASDNVGYVNNIAGIGRDECTSLHQKQSRSVNTTNSGNLLTVAIGTAVASSNTANANEITTDNTFLVWGDNGGDLSYLKTANGTNVNTTLERIWKVDKSSTADATSPETADWSDQDITLCFTGYNENAYLVVSNSDPNFGTVDYEIQLGTDGCITINSSSLPDGAYFTLGVTRQGPACVNNGIAAWYRADMGATGTAWADTSRNDIDITASSDPTVTELLNYNPAVDFDGNDMYTANLPNFSGNQSYTVFSVFNPANTNYQNLFAIGAAGTRTQIAYNPAFPTNNKRLYHGTDDLSVSGLISGWQIGGFKYDSDVVGTDQFMYSNGATLGSRTTTAALNIAANPLMTVGGYSNNATVNSGEELVGDIAEFVVYRRPLSDTERRQVESYLALKYGITLDVTAATTNYDYVASDGITTMWSAVDNFTYRNDIAGIGKDECTELHQKQSKSINTDDLVTIAVGSSVAATNADNTGSITNDKSFLVWGNDNGSTNVFTTPVIGVPQASVRMARVWKVDKTNWTDQDITVCFYGQTGERYLLIDNDDPAFGTVDQTIKLDINTGCVTINSDKLQDEAYFSLGTRIDGPGCVGSDGSIRVWLRADYGASASTWNDFSGRSNHATAGGTPVTNTSYINYNKAVDFDGSDYFNIVGLNINPGITATPVLDSITTLVVYEPDITTNRGVWGNDNLTTGNGDDRYLRTGDVSDGDGTPPPYTGGNTVNKPTLVTSIMDDNTVTGGGNSFLYVDGANVLNYAQANANGGQSDTYLGRHNSATSSLFDGRIAEFAIFKGHLTTTQRRQAESYLALKYGITLEVAAATAPYNYIASDGSTVVWSAVDNYNYRFDIAGMGKDTCTELYQKQSKSANSNLLKVALGSAIQNSNVENTNTLTNDLAFLVWGHDNGALSFTSNVNGAIANTRLERVWKVDKTLNWNDQDITMCFTGYDTKSYLLISSDAGFATVDQELQLNGSGCVTFNSGSLPDDAYFTLGTSLSGPACVNIGVRMWMRADMMANGATWSDISGNGITATTVNSPSIVSDALNFNPAYLLNDALTQYLTLSSVTDLPYGVTDRTIIGVGYSDDVTGVRSIFSYGTTTANENNRIGQNAANGRYSSTASGGTTAAQIHDVASFWTANVPAILATTYDDAGTDLATLYKNGGDGSVKSVTTPWNTNATGAVGRIGANTANAELWSGTIGEVIVYNRVLSAVELQKVNSYLALKYGITLSNDNDGDNVNFEAPNADGVDEGDYVSADGTVYWDASANSAYHNNIAGIGQDDCGNLLQKQSKSINTGARLTIGLGTIEATNAANTGVFGADKSFLVWGDDNASFTETMTDLPTAFAANTKRFTREWKVDRTGSVGTVQIQFDLSSLTVTGSSVDEFKLLIDRDGDGDFTTGTVDVVDASGYVASTSVTFDNVTLNDGDVFTLSSFFPNVTLSVKVFLQGAALDATPGLMRNSLQTFATDNPGEPDILPTTDPYTGTATYASIHDPLGAAGAVVDWVEIQIRSVADPNVILERKSLLLQTDGDVVDALGGTPTFTAQGEPVYIVVRHRNHIAIVSTSIASFSGAVSYDFTTAASQGHKFDPIGDLEQQVLINGKWCMWAGDAFHEGSMDANDLSVVNVGVVNATFSQYLAIDTYMDGVLDANDLGLTTLNVNNALFSSLVGAGFIYPN